MATRPTFKTRHIVILPISAVISGFLVIMIVKAVALFRHNRKPSVLTKGPEEGAPGLL